MTEKAFTMTSNQYCGSCGSFDLVKNNPSWISKRFLGAMPKIFCYGCDKHFSDERFANNAARTSPLTFDDFFFQTNLRHKQLQKKQIKPFTQALGFSLIACAITGLFLVKLPGELHEINSPIIEWANESSPSKETYEISVVKALQLEFDKLVRAK